MPLRLKVPATMNSTAGSRRGVGRGGGRGGTGRGGRGRHGHHVIQPGTGCALFVSLLSLPHEILSRLRVCFFSGVALTPAGLRAGREICAHPTGDKASQRALYKDMNSVSSQLAGVIENLRSQMNQLDAGARARNSRRLRLLIRRRSSRGSCSC